MKQLLCAADAARMTGLTPAAIRSAARSGHLRVAARTPGGVRLFTESEIERFRGEREARIARALAASQTA